MNILEQVTTCLGIKLVSSRKPVECRTEGIRDLFEQRILAQIFPRDGITRSHIQGSLWSRSFLTDYFTPAPAPIVSELFLMSIERLRQYQKNAIARMEAATIGGKRHLLAGIATGTGKAFMTNIPI
jgi:hypothetical protein